MKIKKIFDRALEFLNLGIRPYYPRDSILFAKNYFNGREIVIAEVGVYSGKHLRSMFQTLNVKKGFAIDLYQAYDNTCTDFTRERLNDKVIITQSQLDGAQKTARRVNKLYPVEFLIGKSAEMINKLPMCDLIYLDGDHSYLAVKKDLELCWNKLKEGGILIGNDMPLDEVNRAINEFIKEKNLRIYARSDDCWMIK